MLLKMKCSQMLLFRSFLLYLCLIGLGLTSAFAGRYQETEALLKEAQELIREDRTKHHKKILEILNRAKAPYEAMDEKEEEALSFKEHKLVQNINSLIILQNKFQPLEIKKKPKIKKIKKAKKKKVENAFTRLDLKGKEYFESLIAHQRIVYQAAKKEEKPIDDLKVLLAGIKNYQKNRKLKEYSKIIPVLSTMLKDEKTNEEMKDLIYEHGQELRILKSLRKLLTGFDGMSSLELMGTTIGMSGPVTGIEEKGVWFRDFSDTSQPIFIGWESLTEKNIIDLSLQLIDKTDLKKQFFIAALNMRLGYYLRAHGLFMQLKDLDPEHADNYNQLLDECKTYYEMTHEKSFKEALSEIKR